MFDFLYANANDAISILKHDHDRVKDLFEKFEEAQKLSEKKKIAAEAIMELKLHAAMEEEIFYPAVRRPIGKKVMNEADEEHHVAKVLIAELESMTGKEDHYDAKFKVLSESVRHHIREEENEMLPRARALTVDMDKLGQKMLARKAQLMKNGVAVFAEEKVVALSKGKGDSPARAASRSRRGAPGPSKKQAISKPKAKVKMVMAKKTAKGRQPHSVAK